MARRPRILETRQETHPAVAATEILGAAVARLAISSADGVEPRPVTPTIPSRSALSAPR